MDGLRCGGWSASRLSCPSSLAFIVPLLTFLSSHAWCGWVPSSLCQVQGYDERQQARRRVDGWRAATRGLGRQRRKTSSSSYALMPLPLSLHTRHRHRQGSTLTWKCASNCASTTTSNSCPSLPTPPPSSSSPPHTLLNHQSSFALLIHILFLHS